MRCFTPSLASWPSSASGNFCEAPGQVPVDHEVQPEAGLTQRHWADLLPNSTAWLCQGHRSTASTEGRDPWTPAEVPLASPSTLVSAWGPLSWEKDGFNVTDCFTSGRAWVCKASTGNSEGGRPAAFGLWPVDLLFLFSESNYCSLIDRQRSWN